MKWLRNWWWARQRALDLELLWPTCKELAPDVDHARACFAMHAFHARCWINYYGEAKLIEVIGALV